MCKSSCGTPKASTVRLTFRSHDVRRHVTELKIQEAQVLMEMEATDGYCGETRRFFVGGQPTWGYLLEWSYLEIIHFIVGFSIVLGYWNKIGSYHELPDNSHISSWCPIFG